MMVALRDLAKIKDISRSIGTRLRNIGVITFYPNIIMNRPMWHFEWFFEIVQNGEILSSDYVESYNARGKWLAHGQWFVEINEHSKQ